MPKLTLIIGGIESRTSDPLNTLARALVDEARVSDETPDGQLARHVNSSELETICQLVLEKLWR